MMKILALMLITTISFGNDEIDNNPELTIEQCQASENHTTINGRYIDVENQCHSAKTKPLGCMKIDTICAEALAISQEPNGQCYYFSDLCLPDGWQPIENEDNPNCHASYMSFNLCPSLIVNIFHSISLTWDIGQPDSKGFRLWRVLEYGNGEYPSIVSLQEVNSSYQENCVTGQLIVPDDKMPSQPITKTVNNICYSFMEIAIATNITYYYVLEEIDKNDQSIFHCNDIAAVTVEDGLPIDLKTVQDYCRQVTGK